MTSICCSSLLYSESESSPTEYPSGPRDSDSDSVGDSDPERLPFIWREGAERRVDGERDRSGDCGGVILAAA